jgi:hypothetical protein
MKDWHSITKNHATELTAQQELDALNERIRNLLPEQYVHCYESVPASSMGSAKLIFRSDGTVAWDEIWTSFCHLALAGGPPHRGQLLPAVPATIAQQNLEKTQEVATEIERGIFLAADLRSADGLPPGWVGARCTNEIMAAWMTRAVVAENIFARQSGNILLLPAGPEFRLEKEIKNVITAVAKTRHYWSFHAPDTERALASKLFQSELSTTPTFATATADEIEQDLPRFNSMVSDFKHQLTMVTGLETVASKDPGWLGLKCDQEDITIWLMRAAIAENVIARREEFNLFLPLSPNLASDQRLERFMEVVQRIWRAWRTNATTPAISQDSAS